MAQSDPDHQESTSDDPSRKDVADRKAPDVERSLTDSERGVPGSSLDVTADDAAQELPAANPTVFSEVGSPDVTQSYPDGKPGVISGGAEQALPTIAGYRIIERLGEGGMGTVWKAVQLSTDREVALKLMSVSLMTDRSKSRFEREVKLAARLNHSNIATVFDSGLNEGVYYYAMELVDGKPLDEFVLSNRLKRKLIFKLMAIVCKAVQHAHENDVVHRDLKPDNITVTKTGKPMVLDFGLAKNLEAEKEGHTVTQTGDVAGTPAYMAPEQAEGRIEDFGPHTDVYALGAILYRLLVGDYPTEMTGTRFQVLVRIVEGQIRKPTELSGDIDAGLEQLLMRALAHDPKDRFKSAGELARAITTYADGASEAALASTAKPQASESVPKPSVELQDLESLEKETPESVDVNEPPFSAETIVQTPAEIESSKKRFLLIGAGITLVPLIIGMIIYAVFFRGDPPPVDSSGIALVKRLPLTSELWVDLMPVVNLDVMGDEVNWRRTPGGLAKTGGAGSGRSSFAVMREMPADYRLHIKLSGGRGGRDSRAGLVVSLPYVDRACNLSIDQRRKKDDNEVASFLGGIDGRKPGSPDNPTRVDGSVLQEGENDIVIEVVGQAIRFAVNEKTIIEWDDDPSRLRAPPTRPPSVTLRMPVISTHRGATIHQLRFAPIEESENSKPPDKSPTPVAGDAAVIDLIELARNPTFVRGEDDDWRVDAGRLLLTIQERDRSPIRIVVPAALGADEAYEIDVTFSQQAGKVDTLGIVMPAGASRFRVDVLPGGQPYWGFARVGEVYAQHELNPTRRDLEMIRGREYRLNVLVQPTGDRVRIEATLDDHPPTVWEGHQSELDAPHIEHPMAQSAIAFEAWRGSRYTVHKATLRRLGNSSSSAPRKTPATSNDVLTSPDWEWTRPVNLGPVINTSGIDTAPFLSVDGLTLYLNSDRPGSIGRTDKTVTLPAAAGKYEVTQAQWLAVMGKSPAPLRGSQLKPINHVSWDDIQSILQKLNDGSPPSGMKFALPTEAQWSMRVARARPVHGTMTNLTLRLQSTVGQSRMRTARRTGSANCGRTPLGSMTCMATSGSGAPIGLTAITIRSQSSMTRSVRRKVFFGSREAADSISFCKRAGPGAGAATNQTPGQKTSAVAW